MVDLNSGGGDGGVVESSGVCSRIGNDGACCSSILLPNPKITSLSDAIVSVISANWSKVAYYGSISQ